MMKFTVVASALLGLGLFGCAQDRSAPSDPRTCIVPGGQESKAGACNPVSTVRLSLPQNNWVDSDSREWVNEFTHSQSDPFKSIFVLELDLKHSLSLLSRPSTHVRFDPNQDFYVSAAPECESRLIGSEFFATGRNANRGFIPGHVAHDRTFYSDQDASPTFQLVLQFGQNCESFQVRLRLRSAL